MNVSLCMIVRDEEANLEACLASIAGLVDEIIIVDTGSRDGTKEIARRHAARIFDFAWIDDFAAARNESIRHATCDWIFWLDADDRVDAGSRESLATLFSTLPDTLDAYFMRCVCVGNGGFATQEVGHVRLFRNDPRLRFRQRVHEQVAPAVHRAGGKLRETDIVIRHEGYTDRAVCRRKQERNLRLLELECQERPLDPFILYYRGTTLLDLDRSAEAIVSLQLCGSLVPKDTAIAHALPVQLADAYGRAGLQQDARTTLWTAHAADLGDADVAFALAMLVYREGDVAAADGVLSSFLIVASAQPKLAAAVGDPSIRRFRARHLLAAIRYLQGRYNEAEGDARYVIETCPGLGDGWLLLGDALRAQGKEADSIALVAQLAATPGTYVARLLLEVSQLANGGDRSGAIRLVEEALTRQPQHPYLARARDRLREHGTESESWRHAAYFLSVRDLPGDRIDATANDASFRFPL